MPAGWRRWRAGDHLWRVERLWPERFQTPGGLFFDQPHGLCGAGYRGGGLGSRNTGCAVIALNGAVLQMFNHGLSAAGMFFLVGVIYERTHTRDLNEFRRPVCRCCRFTAAILIFTAMASLGLPGLGGFVSEFLVVRGAWPVFTAGDSAQHDRAVLHRRLYPQSAQAGAARAVQRTLGWAS